MANLAIKGHATRSEEVIQLLEMLGGKNIHRHDGKSSEFVYVINSSYKGEIDCFYAVSDVYKVYTLEQFLEKFPYKVGDKVIAPTSGKTHIIKSMYWNGNKVCYNTVGEGFNTSYCAEDLKPYKEQTYLNPKTEKAKEEIKENLKEAKTIIMEETITIDIPKGYEFAGVDDNKQQVVFEKIKPQYPKTYEECCEELLLDIDTLDTCHNHGYACSLLGEFQKLLICRDAYWKMAGDWKPLDAEEGKTFCIYYNRFLDELEKASGIFDANAILDFPTEEMRDNFFENFKELIEECKELL